MGHEVDMPMGHVGCAHRTLDGSGSCVTMCRFVRVQKGRYCTNS